MLDFTKWYFKYKNLDKSEGVFIDIGAGSGTEALAILKEYDKFELLAIDLSEPMKTEFIDNYNHIIGQNQPARFNYQVRDVFDIDIKQFEYNKPKVLALSAYCIHHFTLSEKKIIYQKMYDFLDKDGILINIDLFNYSSNQISKISHNSDLEYISSEFDNPSTEYEISRQIPYEIRMSLKDKWINHMNNDNILDTMESQIKVLREIGFKDVECIFRYIQQGILIGIK